MVCCEHVTVVLVLRGRVHCMVVGSDRTACMEWAGWVGHGDWVGAKWCAKFLECRLVTLGTSVWKHRPLHLMGVGTGR